MKNKVLVFDDIIDFKYQEKIKNILIGEETFNDYYFPWYFTQDVTNQKDKNKDIWNSGIRRRGSRWARRNNRIYMQH